MTNPDPEYPTSEELDAMTDEELEAQWKKHDPKKRD